MGTRKTADRIVVENVNVPGYTTRVKADMYQAMRKAMLKILPKKSPGLTQSEIREKVVPHLPKDLYPRGAKSEWWAKVVQLDLEAKGVLIREKTKPLKWYQKSTK